VDFGDWLVKPFPNLPHHIFHRHLIGLFGFFVLAEGAKFTEIGADIRIIDMLVVNEIGVVAIKPLAVGLL